MSDIERFELPPAPSFPLPKWARATAFVGLYALVLAGMVELQQSVQGLVAWFGLEGGGLDRIGLLAGLYVAGTGLRPLLYLPLERNEGLYRMAWSFAAALAALTAATVTAVAVHLTSPAFAQGFPGSMTPAVAAITVLAIGWAATKLATRRREWMAGEITETERRGE